MGNITEPRLVASADWSANEKKRWMCRAERRGQGDYVVCPPEPVGEHKTLFRRLTCQVEPSDSILIGFDFPIGLPAKYAARSRLSSFRQALPQFGSGHWSEFYTISDTPKLERPFFPNRSAARGTTRRSWRPVWGFRIWLSCAGDVRRRRTPEGPLNVSSTLLAVNRSAPVQSLGGVT